MIKVLVIAAFPPPTNGCAIMMDLISDFNIPDIKIDKFNLNFNKEFKTLEKFQFKKVFIFINSFFKYIIVRVKIKYDIVLIAHSFRFSAFFKDSVFIVLSKIFGSKIILNARGQKFDVNFYLKSNYLKKKYINFVFFFVDSVITVGKNILQEYKKWENNKIFDYAFDIIHRNIILSYDNKIPIINKELSFSLDGDIITVLYLSILTKSKGVFVFLDAINIIVEQGIKNISFRLCGYFWDKYPNEKNEILSFVESNNLQQFVTIVGFVEGEQKINEFRNADVFVFPSLNDSFGIVNLEAMSAGLPIITTKQGAIPEYICEGINGLFINENDPIDLADKIIYLYENEKLRESMGHNNLNKIKSDFTYESYKNKWEEIFKRVYDNNN